MAKLIMDCIPKLISTRRLSADQSPIPEHQSIFEYWENLRRDRIAPCWAEFDLILLDSKVVPWTAVVDISTDHQTIIYRFWGTQLTEYRGHDYTNRSPLDIPPEELGRFIFDSYISTAISKVPRLDIEEFIAPSGRRSTKSVLRLPLSDDGDTVSKIVACMVFDISYSGTEIVKFFQSVNEA